MKKCTTCPARRKGSNVHRECLFHVHDAWLISLNEFSELLNGVQKDQNWRVEKDTFEMYPDKIQIHESVSLVSSDTDTLPTHPCDFSIAWTSFSETIYNFQEHSRWAGNCTYIRHCMSPLRRSSLARGRLRSIFLYLYRWFLQLGRLVHGLIDHFLADVKLNWSTSPAG